MTTYYRSIGKITEKTDSNTIRVPLIQTSTNEILIATVEGQHDNTSVFTHTDLYTKTRTKITNNGYNAIIFMKGCVVNCEITTSTDCIVFIGNTTKVSKHATFSGFTKTVYFDETIEEIFKNVEILKCKPVLDSIIENMINEETCAECEQKSRHNIRSHCYCQVCHKVYHTTCTKIHISNDTDGKGFSKYICSSCIDSNLSEPTRVYNIV
jgi:hypothetical protein